MSHYEHQIIEKKWQDIWAKGVFRTEDPNQTDKPKYYVLDMFPYPSGAGLHVGHPLGYIASDIVARYKRLRGFNVLHPMGYDAFGLPAEQYAIQTGQHPAVTTEENIKRYREQLDRIGFSFDWSREVKTCDPAYYKWTQWIFIQLFNSWYNPVSNKAESIDSLIQIFEASGCNNDIHPFSPEEWKSMDEKMQSSVLLNYRLAFLSEAMVNWCPALGTVLANDEVKDGVSERGGHPVERKLMTQWSLRISAYAERLLQGLDKIEWSDSLKESQRNWIGKSTGCSLHFNLENPVGDVSSLEVFTTRPDTVFGVSFLAIAPEHELIDNLCTGIYRQAALDYTEKAKNRSERERQSEVKNITGAFTGSYVIHPFTGKKVQIWVADYVLGGYGTGAVMGVPAHDSRDYSFAKFFNLDITEVVKGGDISIESYDAKEGILINSDFLNGLEVKDAIKKAISEIEQRGLGKGKTNYRLRDAVFGRQRYWGEPIPVYYQNNIPKVLPVDQLPLRLPEIDKYLPTESGEPPLARANNWNYNGYPLETTTMPGWAGSSWYFLRYMDPQNDQSFASKAALDYWKDIDLYIGGSEHATGHLLYFRFWTKFLYDLGYIPVDEPAKKLVNQGMIQGISSVASFTAFSNIVKSYINVADISMWSKHLSEIDSENYTKSQFFLSSDLKEILEKNEEDSEEYKSAIKIITSELDKIAKQIGLSGDSSLSHTFNCNFSFTRNIPIHYTTFKSIGGKEVNILDVESLKQNDIQFKNAFFIPENQFICSTQVEKMSKSKWNVVNPDDVCNDYGADTLRLYEMFLGPLQDAKPWSTQGIEGVLRFLRKFWRLYHSGTNESFFLSDEEPSKAELKILHKTIKKATDDIDNFSFNTSVSAFMVCVNELQDLKCNKRAILEPLSIILSPYAPHITEEIWEMCGHTTSVSKAQWPAFNPEFLIENEFNYPVSFNGKVRFNLNFALDKDLKEMESEILNNEQTLKYLEGKPVKKVIIVKGKIVNVVA